MGIDWEAIAKQVGGLNSNGNELTAGTPGGRRALELLLGEENLRDVVDYCVAQKPGYFTAEMVLKIIGSKVAQERCYEIYKTGSDSECVRNDAVFVLACISDIRGIAVGPRVSS